MAVSSRTTEIYPISLRELEVLRVEDLTPGMRRIIFGGPGLGAVTIDGVPMPALVSDGFDDDMRLIFPDPETGARPYPPPVGDGSLDWTAEVNELFRVYTVRWYDPGAGAHGELAVDFVVHPGGLAAEWALAAEPGDAVWAAGPKACRSLPVHRDWLLLLGDETALPAIGRALAELPAGYPCRAVVEVAEAGHVQELDSPGAVEVTWAVRERGESLAEAAGALDWPAGDPYVWVAGEAGKLKPLRTLVKERGVDRADVEFTGYWRETAAPAAAAAGGAGGAAPRADSSFSALQRLHDLADVAPGFAIRAGVVLGVFAAIDDLDEPTLGAVAGACGVAPDPLLRLLRYLASLDAITLDEAPGADPAATPVGLGPIGAELTDPGSFAVRTLSGAGWDRLMGLVNLEAALRGGAPVPVGATGRTWAAHLEAHPEVARDVSDLAMMRAMWVAPAVPETLPEPVRAGEVTVAVAGPGAAVYASEIARLAPAARVRLLGDGDAAAAAAAGERVTAVAWSPGQPAGAGHALVIDPFGVTGDAAGLLGGLGCPVTVITKLLEPTGRAEDHDYAEDLARLALEGTRSPAPADLDAAAAAAGLTVAGSRPVGWGVMLAELRPA